MIILWLLFGFKGKLLFFPCPEGNYGESHLINGVFHESFRENNSRGGIFTIQL